MSGSAFKIEDVLGSLTFDFRPYVDKSGSIPEPTNDMVDAFRASFRKTLMVGEAKTADEAIKNLVSSGTTAEEAEKLVDDLWTAVVVFCGNVFTLDDFKALPYRGRRAFIGWLTGVFFRPEA